MKISTNDPKGSKKNPPKQPMTSKHQHIEVKDVATYCMVSTTTVRRWLKDGKLTSIKLPSNQYRISIEDFKDFLRRYNIPVSKEFNHRF